MASARLDHVPKGPSLFRSRGRRSRCLKRRTRSDRRRRAAARGRRWRCSRAPADRQDQRHGHERTGESLGRPSAVNHSPSVRRGHCGQTAAGSLPAGASVATTPLRPGRATRWLFHAGGMETARAGVIPASIPVDGPVTSPVDGPASSSVPGTLPPQVGCCIGSPANPTHRRACWPGSSANSGVRSSATSSDRSSDFSGARHRYRRPSVGPRSRRLSTTEDTAAAGYPQANHTTVVSVRAFVLMPDRERLTI